MLEVDSDSAGAAYEGVVDSRLQVHEASLIFFGRLRGVNGGGGNWESNLTVYMTRIMQGLGAGAYEGCCRFSPSRGISIWLFVWLNGGGGNWKK